eukprot:1194161-Prorocentrum_minimum.AAC.5
MSEAPEECSSASASESPFDFRTSVHEWLRIEEELSTIQKTLRERRKRKQVLSEFIATYMQQHEKEVCSVGDNNALVLSKRKSTLSLKKEHILEVLKTHFQDIKDDTRDSIVKEMYDKREVREKTTIKKTSIG